MQVQVSSGIVPTNAAGNTARWFHLHDAENYPVFLNNASMKMTWPSPAMNCSIAPAKR
jgi:hypothetical protein